MAENERGTYQNVDALGAEGTHFPPRNSNGVDHWDIYNVLSRLGVVERDSVSLRVGSIITGIHLRFSDLVKQFVWEQLFQ